MSKQRTIHDELMKRVKKHLDKRSLEQLVSDYTPPASAMARQMLGDPTLAEDAVQEAFVRVIRKRRQYVSSRPFSHWFYAILRNICIDTLRRQKREKAAVQHLKTENRRRKAEHRYLTSDFRSLTSDFCPLSSVIGTLGRHERAVLELRVVHSMTFEDIAMVLDISVEAAKKRAQRGLRKLRKQIEQSERRRRQAV